MKVNDEEGVSVRLPSGVSLMVLSRTEAQYVRSRQKEYMETFKFTNVSDLADLDRVVTQEMLIHRWQQWLSMRKDDLGTPVDEATLRRGIDQAMKTLEAAKKSLKIDKDSRDRESSTDGASYVADIRMRAHEFGYHRDMQLAVGIELCQQLIGLWQLYVNCTELERKETHVTAENIVDWIGAEFKVKFEAVDARFKVNQRMWFRDGMGL